MTYYPMHAQASSPPVSYPPVNTGINLPPAQPAFPGGPAGGYTPGAMPPASPRPPRRPGWGRVGIAAAMVATAIGGGIVGALLTATTQHTSSTTASSTTTAPAAADTHTQDVQLCTAYATINAVRPKPETSGMEVLPAANALQLAINGNPGASPAIRSALEDVLTVFNESMASKGDVRTRGLAEPPAYDKDRAQAVYDRAWDACRLGE